MRMADVFPVDFQEIHQAIAEVNKQYACELTHITRREGRETREQNNRRVLGKYGNEVVEFCESNGVTWVVGVRLNLNAIRPEQQAALVRAIAPIYFAQDWSHGQDREDLERD